MPFWTRITGGIAALGVGGAASAAMEPILEVPKQTAWHNEPNRVLGVNELARLIAQGKLATTDAVDESKRNGFAEGRLRALVQLSLEAPTVAEALILRRRKQITEAQLKHALAKAQIEDQFHDAIVSLVDDVLDPGQLAAAIHRGLIPDPGLLKGEQPQPPFKVEAYPVYPIDAVAESQSSGYDRDRLGVLVGLQGLPMGVIEAAQAFYRKIITRGDYIRAFNESNNRNEWADAVLEYARQIPTARDFFENALRGYHDLQWAQEQAHRHGMSDADSLVIYQNQGRPMNIRQITQALSRGATFNPEPGELKDPYEASVVEGNIKPAYYEMAKALKYTLPSPFVMRQLTASGVWSEAKAAKRLKDSGWIPADADEAAAAWAAPSAATGDTHLGKAQNQLWTTVHRSYVADETGDADAAKALETLGVPGATQTQVLALWKAERALIRKQLTPAQIKKAFVKMVLNPRTGAKWTRADAIEALVARGYTLADAQTYIDT